MKNKIVQGIHKALIEASKKNESQKKFSFSYDNDNLKKEPEIFHLQK